MQAVVLAGGLATRMRPHTLTTPKSLLVVAGKPFIDWQLETLARHGYMRVVLCIAHLGEKIREHVGDGARFGLRVTYSDEGRDLLGTGGALRAALSDLEPEFLVTYGDSYLPFDYAGPLAMLRAKDDCDGVMSIYKNDGKWDRSNVTTDRDWVLKYAKNTGDRAFDHIDYGAMALRRDVIAARENGRFGLDEVQRDLAAKHRLRAYVARERFFEIGSEEGLETLERALRKQ